MKHIIYLIAFLIASIGWACENDDKVDVRPFMEFSEVMYTLEAESSLDLKLCASEPVKKDLSVKFSVRGAAVEGEDYELSAKEFVFHAGDSVASVSVTPKNNYVSGRAIRVDLHPIAEYRFGEFDFTIIDVMTKDELVCSFGMDSYVLPNEIDVEMNVTVPNMEGLYWQHANIVNIPFEVGENSTAIEGVHYEFVDNPDKVCAMLPNKSRGNFRIRFLKWEEGKDKIYLFVKTDDARFTPGNIDQTVVSVQGPTTLERLKGKWMFAEAKSFDYIKANHWGSEDELAHLPEHVVTTDWLEFAGADGSELKVHFEGDLAWYFRDCRLSFMEEKQLYLYGEGSGMRPPQATFSIMQASQANVLFSATSVDLKPAKVGFRLLADNETLEVFVWDYVPTDFLFESYMGPDYWDEMLGFRYYFKKVK